MVRGRRINGKVPEPLLRRKTGVVHPICRCSLKSFNWEPALKAPALGWGWFALWSAVSRRRMRTSPDLRTLLKGVVPLCCSLDALGMEAQSGEEVWSTLPGFS